jgi:methionyl aminopeptidase
LPSSHVRRSPPVRDFVTRGTVKRWPRPADLDLPASARPTWGLPGHPDHDDDPTGPKPLMYDSYGTILPAPAPYVSEAELAGEVTDGPLSKMRRSCALAARVLAHTRKLAETPGTTTEEIDAVAREVCVSAGAYPSPLNYCGFAKSVCTSVNDVLCHGIPDARPLEKGDIVNVDVSVYLDGYHGDTSATFYVGGPEAVADRRVVEAAEGALHAAIEFAGPGKMFKDIGILIEDYATQRGFNVPWQFCGHGIGQHFHQPPTILHTRNNLPGVMLPGHVFTIEPILTEGTPEDDVWDDGWTHVTKDGGRAAQFEHVVLITKTGREVLTLPPDLS